MRLMPRSPISQSLNSTAVHEVHYSANRLARVG
eukprot:COSAG02_NODE_46571_length_347_cov_2.508065_1_plen_32_part_10